MWATEADHSTFSLLSAAGGVMDTTHEMLEILGSGYREGVLLSSSVQETTVSRKNIGTGVTGEPGSSPALPCH